MSRHAAPAGTRGRAIGIAVSEGARNYARHRRQATIRNRWRRGSVLTAVGAVLLAGAGGMLDEAGVLGGPGGLFSPPAAEAAALLRPGDRPPADAVLPGQITTMRVGKASRPTVFASYLGGDAPADDSDGAASQSSAGASAEAADEVKNDTVGDGSSEPASTSEPSAETTSDPEPTWEGTSDPGPTWEPTSDPGPVTVTSDPEPDLPTETKLPTKTDEPDLPDATDVTTVVPTDDVDVPDLPTTVPALPDPTDTVKVPTETSTTKPTPICIVPGEERN